MSPVLYKDVYNVCEKINVVNVQTDDNTVKQENLKIAVKL